MRVHLFTEEQLDKLVLNQHYEITINNIYQLYQIIDYTNLLIKEKYNTPDCHRCGVCCNGVFDISSIEAQVVREALTTNYIHQGLFPPIPEETLAHRLNLAREQLDIAIQNNLFICPFYNHQTGCLIYKVRTLICRVFEVAVPNFDFIDEVREELLGNSGTKNSGILCPNLKNKDKYPNTFMVWDLEGLTSLLEKMYPNTTKYEARLLAFFKYEQKNLKLSGQPVKFKISDYLKVIKT